MTEEQIDSRLAEWRAKYPKMFSHADALSDEVWIGDHLVDVAEMNLSFARKAGVVSARLGVNSVLLELKVSSFRTDGNMAKEELVGLAHLPMFANAREYARLAP